MESEGRRYKQMTLALREEISRAPAAGLKQDVIARKVGFCSCPIDRAVPRQRIPGIGCRTYRAQARTDDAAGRKDVALKS